MTAIIALAALIHVTFLVAVGRSFRRQQSRIVQLVREESVDSFLWLRAELAPVPARGRRRGERVRIL